MATRTENKVTAGEVVSATQKFTNYEDSSRRFNISVEAIIRDKKVSIFNSGALTSRDISSRGNANFSCGENLNFFAFNSNDLTAAEIKEAVDAVIAFIEDVKETVETNNEG